MRFDEFIHQSNDETVALSEGSIFERLRRYPAISYDPFIAHSALIYDDHGRQVLAKVHREYVDVAQKYQLPIFMLTDTWRANPEKIAASNFQGNKVNQDNVRFLADLRAGYGTSRDIFIGGLIGVRGDAYKPEQALSRLEAESFHAQQLAALAEAGVDFLYAAPIPAVTEAQGIAAAMSKLGLPYLLSFVIYAEGTMLDGTPLGQAMDMIDNTVSTPPAGYAINCVHPKIFSSAMQALEKERPAYSSRIVSYQANTANLRPEELNEATELITEEPEILAELMMEAEHSFHTKFMGGCCGTDTRHIEQLAKRLRMEKNNHHDTDVTYRPA
jgi:homocysteine S-methyltransferase